MSSIEKPKVLLWNLEVWSAEDGPLRFDPLAVEKLEAESRFAVSGAVDEAWPYLYVVEEDETRLITVLAVVDAAAAGLVIGAAARVPSAGVWLSLAAAGLPRVVASPSLLTRDEIALLLGGHSPPPSPTTIKTS